MSDFRSFPLQRILSCEYLSAEEIQSVLSRGSDFSREEIRVGDVALTFRIEEALLAGLRSLGTKTPTIELDHVFESRLAEAIHEGLKPLRKADPNLLRDPGLWTWLGLYPLRDYVIHRWCEGLNSSGGPLRTDRCTYFLTSDSLQGQARCAVRRLWIAADACERAGGNGADCLNLLKLTDLYTGIFERMIGLDAELAVEVAAQFVGLSEDERRRGLRLLGAVLSTTMLEVLDSRQQKAVLVAAAKSEAAGIVI